MPTLIELVESWGEKHTPGPPRQPGPRNRANRRARHRQAKTRARHRRMHARYVETKALLFGLRNELLEILPW